MQAEICSGIRLTPLQQGETAVFKTAASTAAPDFKVTVEDLPDFDKNLIRNADSEGEDVLSLVLEVTRRENENKKQFLKRILDEGSQKAKILKCADRISNMISLGYVTDPDFIERYCNETEFFLFPMALEIDFNMYQELIGLVMTRRRYLEDGGYFCKMKKDSAPEKKENE